jgi:hypothetical protein
MLGPHTFDYTVRTEAELRKIMGTPSELAVGKQLARLDHHCRAFVALSPFVLVGTNDEGLRLGVRELTVSLYQQLVDRRRMRRRTLLGPQTKFLNSGKSLIFTRNSPAIHSLLIAPRSNAPLCVGR